MADSLSLLNGPFAQLLDPESSSFLQRLEELNLTISLEMSAEEMRAKELRISEIFGGNVDFSGSESEFFIPGERGGRVAMSVYQPFHISSVPTIFIYFHGGGLKFGSRNTCATMLKMLAKRAGCIVANVEYRLTPENEVLAAFEDCRAATAWIIKNKCVIGGHDMSHVGVGGEGSGGQLAASVTHDIAGLAFQILVCPFTHAHMKDEHNLDIRRVPIGPGTFHENRENDYNLENVGPVKNPVIFPFLRPCFTGLPPALCVLAEVDQARRDGIEYCQKLSAAGVPVEMLLAKGAVHSFFCLTYANQGALRQVCAVPGKVSAGIIVKRLFVIHSLPKVCRDIDPDKLVNLVFIAGCFSMTMCSELVVNIKEKG